MYYTNFLAAILDEMDEYGMEKPDVVMRFSDLHYQFHLGLITSSGSEALLNTYCRLNLNTYSLLFYQHLSNQG